MHERQVPMLVSDFDGTMTRTDFFTIALNELVPPGTPNAFEEYVAGQITHFEALQRIFAAIHGDEDRIMTAARGMEVDDDLAEALARLQARGWAITVASAGCAWYIDRLLRERDIAITVHANPGELIPGDGLRMRLPIESPYYAPTTGIDKVAITRDAVQRHSIVAFAGDGRPDLPAAMLVPPERRFARGWLAEEFTTRGVPFRAFTGWSHIADILINEVTR